MSDYSITTDFSDKDALTTGDPEKVILGADFDVEFDAIAVAIATKYDVDSLASQGQAQAGASNTVLMTPLRVQNWADANAGIVGDLRALSDPNADRLLFWDDSAGAAAFLSLASNELAVSGTSLGVGSNIPKLNVANTFTSPVTISGNNQWLYFREGDADTDEKLWRFQGAGGGLLAATRTDEDGTGETWLLVQRSDVEVTEIELNADAFDINGDADISGTLTVNNTFTVNSGLALIQATNNPAVQVWDTDAGEDTGRWAVGRAQGNVLQLGRTLTDANNGVANGIVMTRSGTTITEVELNATTLDFNGDADISGTLNVGGVATFSASDFGASAAVLIQSSVPVLAWSDTNAGTDNGLWNALVTTGGTWQLRAYNDAADSFTAAISISRTAEAITEIELNATTLDFNGAADISGTLSVGGAVTAGIAATSTSSTLVAGQIHNRNANTTVNNLGAGRWVAVQNTSTSAITLSQGSGVTLELGGTTTTGNRTLGPKGFAFIYFRANNTATVQGSGVS